MYIDTPPVTESPASTSGNAAVVRGMRVSLSSNSVTPGTKDPISIEATIIFAPSLSTNVSGTGLWRLAMYGAKTKNGSGDHFQRVEQTLSSSQQAQPLVAGGDITFVDAYGEIDITAIGCGEFRFICFDFLQGESPSPDFSFTSLQPGDDSKLTVCNERPCLDAGL